MINKCMKFVKESGLGGSLIAAVIISLSGFLIPYFKKYFQFLNQEISFSLHISSLLSFTVIVVGALYFLVRLITNPTRKFGQLFGYYRKYLNVTISPYLMSGQNIFFTRRELIMEYTIFRDGITTIGPFTIYAFRPRGTGGSETIQYFKSEVQVNGSSLNIFCEDSNLGTDGKNILLRSKIPLNAGDNVYLKLQYDVFGENAICQEELDNFLSQSNLKDTLRNRVFKKMNCEAVYYSPSYANQYQIKVLFPENYPWRQLDNLDNIVDIFIGLRQLSKERLKRIIKTKIEPNSITVKYLHRFPAATHWLFIYWKLPNKTELISRGLLDP